MAPPGRANNKWLPLLREFFVAIPFQNASKR